MPRLRKEVIEAEDRQQVAIISALRGPDLHDEMSQGWKEKLTCPIRCWAYGCSPYELGNFGMDEGAEPPKDREGWLKLRSAAFALKEGYEWGSAGEIDKAMLHYLSHIHKAIKMILVLDPVFSEPESPEAEQA